MTQRLWARREWVSYWFPDVFHFCTQSLIVHIGQELIPEHLKHWPLSSKSCQIIDNSVVADSVVAGDLDKHVIQPKQGSFSLSSQKALHLLTSQQQEIISTLMSASCLPFILMNLPDIFYFESLYFNIRGDFWNQWKFEKMEFLMFTLILKIHM